MDRPKYRAKQAEPDDFGLPAPIAAMVRTYSGCKDLITMNSGEYEGVARTISQGITRTCSGGTARTHSVGWSAAGPPSGPEQTTARPQPDAACSPPSPKHQRFPTLAAFYPFYQSQHTKFGNRVCHVIGTSCALMLALLGLLTSHLELLLLALFSGYFFAWIGHFFIEHNRPATFKYPVYSLLSDFRMWFNIISGRERLSVPE